MFKSRIPRSSEVRRFVDRLMALRGQRLIIVATSAGVALFIGWAAFTQVDEVTRAEGKIIPSSKGQIIQSSEPATVKAILVSGGEHVKKGELLVQMDDTESSSALGEIVAEDRTMTARAARLGDEAEGQQFDCPPEIRAATPEVCASEASLEALRAQALDAKRNAATATVAQRRSDLAAAQANIVTLRKSVALGQKQVDMLAPLAAKSIVPQTDLINAQRELTESQGKLASAQEDAARAQAGIAQAQADATSTVFQFRQEAQDEADQLNAKLAVIHESSRGAEGKLSKTELRSPVDGVVNDVQVTTVGGFVNAGQKIMEVVPVGEKLLVEARVKPKDIAFIRVGQPALVKVTAYDFETYGGVPGRVVQVAADSTYDETNKEAYFTVIVETDRSFLGSPARPLPITPGMICSADIITGHKSILDYMLKPVVRARYEALRER